MEQYTNRVMRPAISWALGVLLIMVASATAWAADQGPAPSPENLRLVLDDQGFVDRLAWDPPVDAPDPTRYDVNYRFASEAPSTAQVFWTTRETQLTAAESFGRFVKCEAGHHPSDEWIVWITYPTSSGPSQASNQISMCFP